MRGMVSHSVIVCWGHCLRGYGGDIVCGFGGSTPTNRAPTNRAPTNRALTNCVPSCLHIIRHHYWEMQPKIAQKKTGGKNCNQQQSQVKIKQASTVRHLCLVVLLLHSCGLQNGTWRRQMLAARRMPGAWSPHQCWKLVAGLRSSMRVPPPPTPMPPSQCGVFFAPPQHPTPLLITVAYPDDGRRRERRGVWKRGGTLRGGGQANLLRSTARSGGRCCLPPCRDD